MRVAYWTHAWLHVSRKNASSEEKGKFKAKSEIVYAIATFEWCVAPECVVQLVTCMEHCVGNRSLLWAKMADVAVLGCWHDPRSKLRTLVLVPWELAALMYPRRVCALAILR